MQVAALADLIAAEIPDAALRLFAKGIVEERSQERSDIVLHAWSSPREDVFAAWFRKRLPLELVISEPFRGQGRHGVCRNCARTG
ncbi:hypothetical protein RHECNPAF_2000015 [Rhizobium etli CNPAF512]|nr:hypothetical protein RHECNPAF_2000015 [Rhizobium etli CNPAF512]